MAIWDKFDKGGVGVQSRNYTVPLSLSLSLSLSHYFTEVVATLKRVSQND